MTESVYTTILKNLRNLFPIRLGIIKESSNEDTIDIRHGKFGDKYIVAVAEGIKVL